MTRDDAIIDLLQRMFTKLEDDDPLRAEVASALHVCPGCRKRVWPEDWHFPCDYDPA